MAEIKLANGREVKELRVWDGVKWVAKRGRIFNGEKWIDFIRPPLSFIDNFKSTNVVENISEGQRTILLEDSTGFDVGEEIILFDGIKSEGIKIVGRNYINGNSIQAHGCKMANVDETYLGIPVINLVVNSPDVYNNFGFRFFNASINEESQYFAFSLYYKINSYAHNEGKSVAGYFTLEYEDGTTKRLNISNPVNWVDSHNWGKWIKLENVFDLGERKKVKEIKNCYFYVDLAHEGDILVTLPKFEVGNIATEWSPYLGDIYTDTSNVISVTPIRNSYSLGSTKVTIKPKGALRQTLKTIIREPVNAGQRTLLVQNPVGFNVGDEVTISDGVNNEDVRVMGRNLLKQVSDGNYSNVYRDVIIQDGIMYWKQIGTATAPFTFYLYDTTLKTGDFVFSFKTNQIQELRPFIHVDGKTLHCSPVIVEHEDYYHVSMIFKNITISNSVYFYGTKPFEPPKEVQFWDFKLEKGSQATPWTPAPEDIYGTADNVLSITPTKNSYKGNSIVARTNAVIENNKLVHSVYKTYSAQ